MAQNSGSPPAWPARSASSASVTLRNVSSSAAIAGSWRRNGVRLAVPGCCRNRRTRSRRGLMLCSAGRSRGLAEHGIEDLLRLGLDAGQVLLAAERLGVELVDVLRPRRPGGEPAGLGADLQAAQRLAVPPPSGEPAHPRAPPGLLDPAPL